jgi:hypothetical protein
MEVKMRPKGGPREAKWKSKRGQSESKGNRN